MQVPIVKPAAILLFILLGNLLYPTHSTLSEDWRKVRIISDGDSIVLLGGLRVRYIGIDTPETKHPYKEVEYFGKEASLYNKKMVEGKCVRLEFDVEKRDKYNRLLAYVYVGDIFVNARLVEDGFAQIYTIPPNIKYQQLFLKLQREARENNRGLWGK